MTTVVFAAPIFSPAASQMIEAAASFPHVRLGVVAQEPLERLPSHLAARVAAHWRVDDVTDEGQLESAVRELTGRIGPAERLFGAFEQLQVPLAKVRESLGIPGMSSAAALNFRDKGRMKDLLRAAKVPVAQHQVIERASDAREFVARTGFPIVVKPLSGAGARATHRVASADELDALLATHRLTAASPLLAEEFLRGREHSLETVSINGNVVWHSLTHYDPTPLEVLENPWIQWCVVLPREIDDPRYNDIRATAARALAVLGMDTGVTHCEWFRRDDGTLAISEIAARPPGAQITTMISRAHDVDFVRAWMQLMIEGSFQPPKRRYAVGAAFLRGQGKGRVRGIHGLDVVEREFGPLICDFRLPSPGQVPSGSYEGEGFILLRHHDTEVVTHALRRLVSVVRVTLA